MLKEAMEGKKEKKMQKMKMKEYRRTGNLYKARATWEGRSHMLWVAGNYPGHMMYATKGWRCQVCPFSNPTPYSALSRNCFLGTGLPAGGAGRPGAPCQERGLL